MSEPRDTGQYVPELDGLRGVAITLVMLYHAVYLFDGREGLWPLAYGGWVGVDLFFVVSGFLITRLLLLQPPLRIFWARRALRIAPLAVLYVGLLLLNVRSRDPAGVLESFDDWPYYLFWLGNLRIASSGVVALPLMVLWSLALEEQFYLLWPFATRWVRAPRLLWVCGALLALASVARVLELARRGYPAVYVSTWCRVDTLAVGCGLALLLSEPARAQVVLRLCRRIAPVSGSVLLVFFVFHVSPNPANSPLPLLHALVAYPAVALCWASILGAALFGGPLPAVLRLGALRGLGKICYGLYLWHTPVGLVLRSLSLPLSAAAMLAVFFACTVAVASLSWFAFERPLLSLKPRASASP